MDTRLVRPTLTALAATVALSASIASAGPTLVLEHVTTPLGEHLAIGFEARALCLRIVADPDGSTVWIAPPRGCQSAACRSIFA
jgi:hypothetical protein